jgi:hypothetical protein
LVEKTIVVQADTLYTILFFLAAAILSAFMNKKKRKETEEDSWPDPSESPHSPHREPSSPAIGWEEELRRLLEGKTPASELPSTPPPLIVTPEPPPAFVPPPPPLPTPARGKSLHDWRKKAPKEKVPVARLTESGLKSAGIGSIQARVARQMKAAANLVDHPVDKLHRSNGSNEVRAALRLFRSPRSARMAVIVSEVLGPPKAMQRD